VSFNWYHTTFGELIMTTNTLQTFADYTPVTIASPIDGSAITIYNVSNAARTRTLNLNTNAGPDDKKWTNAVEFSGSARLLKGAQIFGGISADRTTTISCSDPSNPNLQLFCDQSVEGVPWLINGKMAGTIRLKYDIQLGASLQTYRYRVGPSATTGTQWLLTPTTRYAANCTGPCTPNGLVDPGMTTANLAVPLISPGNDLSDRIKQVDINVGKWIQISPKLRVQPEVSLFNALNNLAAYQFRSFNYGTSSYYQPSTTLLPRTLRFGVQAKW
jgi:hypothetical protein